MVDWALRQDGQVAIRYPKATVANYDLARTPLEMGRSETLIEGSYGLVIACGTLVGEALKASAELRDDGLEVAVINARFVKPLDPALKERMETAPLTVTVE